MHTQVTHVYIALVGKNCLVESTLLIGHNKFAISFCPSGTLQSLWLSVSMKVNRNDKLHKRLTCIMMT